MTGKNVYSYLPTHPNEFQENKRLFNLILESSLSQSVFPLVDISGQMKRKATGNSQHGFIQGGP